MLARLSVSVLLALLAVVATTGVSFAAENPDRDEVLIGTFLVALGTMFVLFVFYLIRRVLGLDKAPPPEGDAGDHH